MWAFRRPEVDNDDLPAISTQWMRNALKIRQFKIRRWLVKLHENHYIVGSSTILAHGAHLPDLLHSLTPPARAGVRMRLAAQRQVQMGKSRAVPESAIETKRRQGNNLEMELITSDRFG